MRGRRFKDRCAHKIMLGSCLLVSGLTPLIIFGLYWKSRPILAANRLWRDLLFSFSWHPARGEFGLAGFIAGSLWVTAGAMMIAVPLSLLTAVYLSEYCRRNVRGWVQPVMDVLGGIPPVVYGAWGILVVVPFVRDIAKPFLKTTWPFFPFLSNNETGFSVLAGSLVLAIMICPTITSIAGEVLAAVPSEIRESSLALGATRWQTIKHPVWKDARGGLAAAILLGLSRAFGETMAVLMVAGCQLRTCPSSIFDTAYPLPALIANTYGEMMSIPAYEAAVFLAALVLLVVTILFNAVGWGILIRVEGSK